MHLCSPERLRTWTKSPSGDSWGSTDRAGISADHADHTNLRGVNLRESARAAGDMVYGGSSVVFDGAKIRFFRVNICPGF